MVSFTKLFTTGLLATSALAAPVEQLQKRGSNKRGAAYNDANLVSSLADRQAVSWAYNWNMLAAGSLPQGVEFVPMLWGLKDIGGWADAIKTALTGSGLLGGGSSGNKYIMGFNEPDMASQAAMSPSDAASYYMQYITPHAGEAKLISPAVTSSTDPNMGLQWFNSFMDSCGNCKISGLAVHWYGNTPDEFKSFVNQAIQTASAHGLQEVWITEFALQADAEGQGSPDVTAQFLSDVLPWLDSQQAVSRYAYFMCAENHMLNGGSLNKAGEAYAA